MRKHVHATPGPPAPAALIQGREATIKTAQITIKTLTVSGRQVTLALFRQLQDEDLISGVTGEIRGACWGRINYFPAGCQQDHLHAVWQTGDELRRSCVYAWPYRSLTLEGLEKKVNLAQNAHLTRLWLDKEVNGPTMAFLVGDEWASAALSWGDGGNEFTRTVHIPREPGRLLAAARTTLHQYRNYSDAYHSLTLDEARKDEARAQTALLNWLETAYGTADEDALHGRFSEAQAAVAAFKATWLKSYNVIAATDQLFIAT
jgi:hypothetical protein